MDAFFASVEQRDNPLLQGKPIAVGGHSNRGVVAAASYEARKYGVFSAMPSVTAKAKCPNLIIVKPNGKAYKEASNIIRSIFHEYTDVVEPLSLDEAFLDVTFQKKGIQSATLLAKEIKERIKEDTLLTASAGISYNKFLAKIASDYNKPDGLYVIPPENAIAFLDQLKIEKFFGVGKVTVDKFHRFGVFNGADLRKISEQELSRLFGKAGNYYYNIVRGIDNREVKPFRERKSIGAEQTFNEDITDVSQLEKKLLQSVDRIWKIVESKKSLGKTITIKIKFFDFIVITRSRTLISFVETKNQLIQEVLSIFRNELPFAKPIRLLGVSLSNFKSDNVIPEQMTIKY